MILSERTKRSLESDKFWVAREFFLTSIRVGNKLLYELAEEPKKEDYEKNKYS